LGGGYVARPQKIQGLPKTANSIACGFTESTILNDGVAYNWDWKDMRARPLKELESFYVKQMAFGWRHRVALVAIN